VNRKQISTNINILGFREFLRPSMKMSVINKALSIYCIPIEDGLRTETCSGSNREEKEDCSVDSIIAKLIT
jgi:hypothetical protein